MVEPELPKFVKDIICDVIKLPVGVDWRRWRLAISIEEHQQLRTYFKIKGDDKFYHCLRGFNFYIEERPLNPDIIMEFT
jgi:hypothetical protein